MPPPLNKQHHEHPSKISGPTLLMKYLLRVLEIFHQKFGTKKSHTLEVIWDLICDT